MLVVLSPLRWLLCALVLGGRRSGFAGVPFRVLFIFSPALTRIALVAVGDNR